MSVIRCLVVSLLLMPALAAAQPSQRYEGLSLLDVLRALQGRGLRIVFSSETVTPAMRVASEPKGRSDRSRLDELLAPHGLRVRTGPGGTLVIVRVVTPPPVPRPSRSPTATDSAPSRVAQYREEVTVEASPERRLEPGVVSQISTGRSELFGIRPVIADDPVRAMHALPHVAAADDFRSEFSIRGSPFRHVGVVIDGVPTRLLQHAAYGRGDTGSLSMLHGDLIDNATLRAGAHVQQFGATLGGQLALAVREGSRERRAFHVAFGPASAAAVAEGPFDAAQGAAAQGSWLVSLRQSYRDWPTRGLGEFDGTMFGFTDALAKIVYDVRPRHQVSFSMIGGHSHIDEVDGAMPYQPGDGLNRTAIANLGVRSTIGSRSVLHQRAYLVAHEFLNKTEAGQAYSSGRQRELSYRADLTRAVSDGLLESGAQVQHARGDGTGAWSGAVYAHYRWQPGSRLTIAPGVRVDHSTLTRGSHVGRWILSEFVVDPRWIVSASAGVSHQLPHLDHLTGPIGGSRLATERATHVDVGLVRRLHGDYRWRTTVYVRRERDVLRPPQGADERWQNALSGSSEGVEVLLERHRPTGLAGWIAYSFGKSRYTDVARAETFWADFDQRHAINVHGVYRLSARSSVLLTFRSGTNFPIPAYLDTHGGILVAGNRRNEVRLRPYARLDARAQRSFGVAGRRVTLFAEVLNVLNRSNVGLANGHITHSGQAVGFTERLMPRLPSAGILVEF
jgi:hypothetical protein